MAALKKIYGEISKTEELDDGTIVVTGIASTPAQDSDGETITAEAMKAALPDYMKFGAVREMHQPKAAGTALKAEVNEDGQTILHAHIVDAEAIKKVKSSVYKGFSIGGKVLNRDKLDKTIITDLKLVEVSLVDRPANPDAVITCYKAEGLEDDEATAKVEEGGDLKKGLWEVSQFAELLYRASWAARDAQWEAECEGDNSPIPLQIRDWLAQGGQILQAMAAEEVAELLATLPQPPAAEIIELAEKTGDISKAGARFSKSTKSDLAALHDAVKAACATLDKLGYADAEEAEEEAEKLAKVAGSELAAAHDALLKACGAAGCPEGEIAADFVTKLATERDTLTKRVKELENMPEPPKGAVMSISKVEDVPAQAESEVVKKADGTVDETATAYKASFSRPIRLT